jgi:putative FmdB family regulatory protein
MPMYEYRCLDCGEEWERAELIAEHEEAVRVSAAPACPRCHGTQVEQVFSRFFAKTGRKS